MPSTLHRGRRVLQVALLAGALAPAAAQARIIELGETSGTPPVPTCPAKPCLAVSRTTGYQTKVGDTRDLFVVPARGRIVAWTITLGNPSKKQVKYFNTGFGGVPRAGIVVFKRHKHLAATVKGRSPIRNLTPFLGGTVQFPLVSSIPVRKGDLVALQVPTWAPALAVGFGKDTSWRASRAKKQCNDTSTQTAVSAIGASTTFSCLYQTARLTYGATMISQPRKVPTAR
jgi:hypothetical protein